MRRFFNRMAGYPDDDESRTEDKVYIQHTRDTFEIAFPKGDIASSTTTVKDLTAATQKVLDVPEGTPMKLVYAGQHLKDENAPLSQYNVKHGAKILCMASKSKLIAPANSSGSGQARPAPQQKKPKIIPPMEKIDLVQKHIASSILPLVEAFERDPPQEKDKRKDEHHRLSETLLGELLKLDSVDVDGLDGAEVRKRRKEMVREIQSMLERLDKVDS